MLQHFTELTEYHRGAHLHTGSLGTQNSLLTDRCLIVFAAFEINPCNSLTFTKGEKVHLNRSKNYQRAVVHQLLQQASTKKLVY